MGRPREWERAKRLLELNLPKARGRNGRNLGENEHPLCGKGWEKGEEKDFSEDRDAEEREVQQGTELRPNSISASFFSYLGINFSTQEKNRADRRRASGERKGKKRKDQRGR